MWVSGTSQFYSIEDVENSAKLSNNTDSNSTSDSTTTDSTNKNVSKMRSYLRRCESAISSINLSAKRSLSLSSPSTPTTTTTAATTSNDAAGTSKSTNSSWYVDEIDPEIAESANESNCSNGKSDEITTQQITESSILNSDEQIIAVQCNHESANNCALKLQQQITLSPVSKIKWNSMNEECFKECVATK